MDADFPWSEVVERRLAAQRETEDMSAYSQRRGVDRGHPRVDSFGVTAARQHTVLGVGCAGSAGPVREGLRDYVDLPTKDWGRVDNPFASPSGPGLCGSAARRMTKRRYPTSSPFSQGCSIKQNKTVGLHCCHQPGLNRSSEDEAQHS